MPRKEETSPLPLSQTWRDASLLPPLPNSLDHLFSQVTLAASTPARKWSARQKAVLLSHPSLPSTASSDSTETFSPLTQMKSGSSTS